MCKHNEYSYKYCPYHEMFDRELLDIAKKQIPLTVNTVFPSLEYGITPDNCMSYMDL